METTLLAVKALCGYWIRNARARRSSSCRARKLTFRYTRSLYDHRLVDAKAPDSPTEGISGLHAVMRMHVLAVHNLICVQQKQHSGLQGALLAAECYSMSWNPCGVSVLWEPEVHWMPVQATYTRIMFPGSTPQEQRPPAKPEKAADTHEKIQQTSATQAQHPTPQPRAKDEEAASSAHPRLKPEEAADTHQEIRQGSAPSAQHPPPQLNCDAEEMASAAHPQSSASSTPFDSPAAAAAEKASPGCSSSRASKMVSFLSPQLKPSSIVSIAEERAEVPDESGSSAADSAESSCPEVLAPPSTAAPAEEGLTGGFEGAHGSEAASSAERSKSAYAAYLDSVASAMQEPK